MRHNSHGAPFADLFKGWIEQHLITIGMNTQLLGQVTASYRLEHMSIELYNMVYDVDVHFHPQSEFTRLIGNAELIYGELRLSLSRTFKTCKALRGP